MFGYACGRRIEQFSGSGRLDLPWSSSPSLTPRRVQWFRKQGHEAPLQGRYRGAHSGRRVTGCTWLGSMTAGCFLTILTPRMLHGLVEHRGGYDAQDHRGHEGPSRSSLCNAMDMALGTNPRLWRRCHTSAANHRKPGALSYIDINI